MSCISALLIWTFAYNYGVLLLFAVFYGIFGNAYHALCKYIIEFIVSQLFHEILLIIY